jgi:DNA-3-methyladenine glycosylase II
MTSGAILNTLRNHSKHFSMSLRRSARVASIITPVPTPTESAKPEAVARYTKIQKPSAAPKKRKSKASATTTTPQDEPSPTTTEFNLAVTDLPATPLPKKRRVAATASPTKPPPFTPTPAGVGLFASSSTSESSHPLEILASLKPRPAEPHATNAPLSTPGGSRVVAYHSSPAKPEDPSPVKKRKAKEVVPPDMGTVKPASTNIDTLLKEAEEYLISVDSKLQPLIEKHHCKMFSPEGLREVVDPFTALASSIMGQQVCFRRVQECEVKNTDKGLYIGLRSSSGIDTQKVHRTF